MTELPQIFYNQAHGMLVIIFEDIEDNFIEQHPTVIDAWVSINAKGYDCNGWIETYLGVELGTALMPICLTKCEPFEGNP